MDENDSTSVDVKSFPIDCSFSSSSSSKRRIGIPKEISIRDCDDSIQKSWQIGLDRLKSSGSEIVEVSVPNFQSALPVYYIIAAAEVSSNLSRFTGIYFGSCSPTSRDASSFFDSICENRSELLGEEVKRRILTGTFVLSSR
jgi:aspartyl-tRNA(Asn)/glutamyl-tRNA(Gln) amidotransferase subunit A